VEVSIATHVRNGFTGIAAKNMIYIITRHSLYHLYFCEILR